MKGQIISVLSVLSVSIFYACGSLDYGKEKPTEILVQADEPNADSAWVQDVSYIMQIKCANCHGPNHHKFAPEKAYTKFPYNFEDRDTFTKMAPLIKKVIFDEEFRAKTPEYAMPPNYSTPLTDLEKAAVKNFIEKKLPVVIAPPAATPDPAATPAPGGGGTPNNGTTPTSLSSSWTSNSCAGCHGANGEGGIGKPLKATALTEDQYKSKVIMGVSGTLMSHTLPSRQRN